VFEAKTGKYHMQMIAEVEMDVIITMERCV
jgi:hypothetical protein